MKKMKTFKLLFCLTLVVLMAFALVACFGGGPSNEPKGCESDNIEDHEISTIHGGDYDAYCYDGREYGLKCDWGQCDLCGAYFDCDKGVKTTWEEIITPVKHENIVKVEEKPASCDNEGTKEYWKCSHCEKAFTTQDGTVEISNMDDYIISPTHTIELVEEGVSATCGTFGELPVYRCTYCGDTFSDEKGENEYNPSSSNRLIMMSGEHSFDGNVCTVCHTYKGTEGIEYELVSDPDQAPFDFYVVSSLGAASGSDTLYIPATYNGLPVLDFTNAVYGNVSLKTLYLSYPYDAYLSRYTLEGCALLENLYISGDVTIGSNAFNSFASLKKVSINGNASLEYSAFENCDALTTVEITGKMNVLGGNCFYGCDALESFDLTNYVSDNYGGEGEVYLADSIFYACESLKSVILPEGLTHIGSGAFAYTALTSFTIPETVVYIGGNAFAYTKITSITIPAAVTQIDYRAFASCHNLNSVTFKPTTLSLGSETFAYCNSLFEISVENYTLGSKCFYSCNNLMSVTIGNDATLDHDDIFMYCDNLAEVVYNGNKLISEFYIHNYSSDVLTVNDIAKVSTEKSVQIERINDFIFLVDGTAYKLMCYVGSATEITLTGTMDGHAYTIAPDAFANNETIETVSISGIAKIPDKAFYSCDALKTVTIGTGVTEIGNEVFQNSHNIESFTLDADVTSFGKDVFSHYTIVSLNFLTSENGAFYAGNAANPYKVLVVVPQYVSAPVINENTKLIADYAFDSNPSIELIVIPSGTAVGNYAFNGCTRLKYLYGLPAGFNENIIEGCTALDEASLTKKVELINGFVFFIDGTNYTLAFYIGTTGEITLTGTMGGHAYTILPEAFKDNRNVTSVNISGIEVIPEAAFEGCFNITSITIGDGVKTIGERAFSGCGSINIGNIKVSASVKKICKDAFRFASNGYTQTNFHVSAGCYYLGDGENNYRFLIHVTSNGTVIHDDTKLIADYAFEGRGVTTVDIPSGLEVIGEFVFKDCTSLTDINGLNIEFNPNIIEGCTSFNKNSLSQLIDGVYYFGTELTGVANSNIEYLIVKGGTTSIAANALRNCTNLRFIYLPESVVTLGTNALPSLPLVQTGPYAGLISQEPFMILLEGQKANITGLNASGGTYIYVFENCTVSDDYIYSTDLPSSAPTDGIELLAYFGPATTLVIPSKIDGKTVVSLNGFTFDGTDVEHLTTPADLLALGDVGNKFGQTILVAPFYNSKIKTVTVNAVGALDIAQQLFDHVTTLESFTVTNSLEFISVGMRAFYGAENLETVTIKADMVYILGETFTNCSSLTSVDVGTHASGITMGDSGQGAITITGPEDLASKLTGVNKDDMVVFGYTPPTA